MEAYGGPTYGRIGVSGSRLLFEHFDHNRLPKAEDENDDEDEDD
jgi:hypothetical protein